MNNEAGFLNKAALLGFERQVHKVCLPNDGGFVYIKELSGKQREEFERRVAQGRKKGDDYRGLRAKLIVDSLVDEEGENLFNPEDSSNVEKMPSSIIEFIFEKILSINGVDTENVKESEAIERNF